MIIIKPDGMTADEAQAYIDDELSQECWKGKEIAYIAIKLDGDNIEIKVVERSPVRRIRRITGYLSQIDSFNDAKQAELARSQKSYIDKGEE